MRTGRKNLFALGQAALDRNTEPVVFISYRRTHCDRYMAGKCAEIVENIPGLHYWWDEEDDCMRQAHQRQDTVGMARCIEGGLDVSSALLGIIGPETFDSPWIPYEIGGARGRAGYAKQETSPRQSRIH